MRVQRPDDLCRPNRPSQHCRWRRVGSIIRGRRGGTKKKPPLKRWSATAAKGAEGGGHLRGH